MKLGTETGSLINHLQARATLGQPEPYPAGSWGLPTADAMMARDGRVWRRL